MILPKTQSADDVAAVASKVGGNVAVLALIETGRGMANAHAISQGATGRLVFGTIDFQLDLGIDGDDMELLHFRSMLVLASRCAGLPPPCDGVTASIGDDIALAKMRGAVSGLALAPNCAYIRGRSHWSTGPLRQTRMHVPGLRACLPQRPLQADR